ncbi:hypothetical protein HK096_005724 [Nowakowskiella sp. JEL0078]|nr:hypothetical protein HK096_005724 [Nowakowskiella sp. JEL0078]
MARYTYHFGLVEGISADVTICTPNQKPKNVLICFAGAEKDATELLNYGSPLESAANDSHTVLYLIPSKLSKTYKPKFELEDKWSKNSIESGYYITPEFNVLLDKIIEHAKSNYGIQKVSLLGHSAGGNAALVYAIKKPELIASVSVLAPEINLNMESAWGGDVLKNLREGQEKEWSIYHILRDNPNAFWTMPIFVQYGTADTFIPLKDFISFRTLFEKRIETENLYIDELPDVDHSRKLIVPYIAQHVKFHSTQISKI